MKPEPWTLAGGCTILWRCQYLQPWRDEEQARFREQQEARRACGRTGLIWWRGQDLNLRPSGYEPQQEVAKSAMNSMCMACSCAGCVPSSFKWENYGLSAPALHCDFR